MLQQQAIRGTFEDSGRTYKAYWNGRSYGNRKYITVTRPNGKQTTITYVEENGQGTVDYGNNSTFDTDRAFAALRSVGVIEEDKR